MASTTVTRGLIPRGHVKTGLTISIVSPIISAVTLPPDEQFINFGNQHVLLSGDVVPGDYVTWYDFHRYICGNTIGIDAIFWSAQQQWKEGDVLFATGQVNLMPVNTAVGPKDPVWSTITTIQPTSTYCFDPQLFNISDDHSLMFRNIPCQGIGKVVKEPARSVCSLKLKELAPLLQYAVFVEFEFYLNRAGENGSPGLKRGVIKSYALLFLDPNTGIQKRYKQFWSGDKVIIAEGTYVNFIGDIIGQLRQEFVLSGGYDKNTPTDQVPVYLLSPTSNLQVVAQDGVGTASPASSSSYNDKISKMKARFQGSSTSSSVASDELSQGSTSATGPNFIDIEEVLGTQDLSSKRLAEEVEKPADQQKKARRGRS